MSKATRLGAASRYACETAAQLPISFRLAKTAESLWLDSPDYISRTWVTFVHGFRGKEKGGHGWMGVVEAAVHSVWSSKVEARPFYFFCNLAPHKNL
jgi:hypothetical protein